MSEYRDTIKNMAKVRGYMRDLYVYGFRTRREFEGKSGRTYDNERRRMESWLGDYIRFDHSAKGKSVCISVDSASVESNPLFVAWRSKSCTDNDIVLHFLLLDLLSGGESLSAPELTERLSTDYDALFDLQTVRGKLREYEREGVLVSRKEGKALRYSLSPHSYDRLPHLKQLNDAVAFFSRTTVGGCIGDTLLRRMEGYTSPFRFKHSHIAHTLDDEITLRLLDCIEEGRSCRITGVSRRSGETYDWECLPLGILDNVETGRRYVTVYDRRSRRLTSRRIDCIDSVTPLDLCALAEGYRRHAGTTAPKRWGVSYSGKERVEQLCIRMRIDEKNEGFVLDRLRREGRGGEVLRIDENTFLYTVEVYDSNEVMPWIRTFVGRIISLEGTNREVVDKFYNDMRLLREMYAVKEGE